jgi:hypothetical protein
MNLDANGTAIFTTAALFTGSHTITATYNPSQGSTFDPSAGSRMQIVQSLTTVGMVDPSTSTWYLRNQNGPGAPDISAFSYGGPGWTPVVGDWNGDGVSSIGVVDPTGMWYLRNENSAGAPDAAGPFPYGLGSWIPVVGDWTGAGHTGIGMFDPQTATWYLRNETGPGGPDVAPFQYGLPGWIPVVGDWTGTGHDGIGMFDPSTGTWYLRNEDSAGEPDAGQFQYGGAGWKPVVGDWNDQGRTTIAVVDPGGNWYIRNSNSSGAPDIASFPYGLGSWVPVAGTYALPALAQRAEGAPTLSALPSVHEAQLQNIVSTALVRIAQAGADPTLLAHLSAAHFEVGSLPSGTLGLASPTFNQVEISSNAAGFGWFIDNTPLQDEEFHPVPGGTLQAQPWSAAVGKMDLLTVVLHEMGHLAGKPDLHSTSDGNLMDDVLAVGTRRTEALDAVFAENAAHLSAGL